MNQLISDAALSRLREANQDAALIPEDTRIEKVASGIGSFISTLSVSLHNPYLPQTERRRDGGIYFVR